jgi:hypothetical protein
MCNPLTITASKISFVGNVNALAYGKSTEKNCRTLHAVYDRWLDWARRHGASFAPDKYILVHFTKAETKHNSPCPLILPTSSLHASPSACVLGVILDNNLRWHRHFYHISVKLTDQRHQKPYNLDIGHFSTSLEVAVDRCHTLCHNHWLLCLDGPTRYAIFSKRDGKGAAKGENLRLRAVSGAYEAIPVQSFQAEVGIPPLPLHNDCEQARF